MFNPKVSIIIPVYNGSRYMRESIDSALAQTYNNIEIIVVNDGSTDNTEEIALSYGESIRYFRKENGGQSTALNFGIEKMTGDYFSWLSHDDVYEPLKVQTQIEYLGHLTNKESVILYSDFLLINYLSQKTSEVKTILFDPKLFRYMLITASPINGCTAIIPRKAFYDIGFFNNNRPHTSDVQLFFDLAEKYNFIHLPKVLIRSRVHSGQMTHKKSVYHNKESNLFLIYCLQKIKRTELNNYGEIYPNFYLKISLNWAGRGYRKAYLYSLNSFRNSGGELLLFYKSLAVCEILFLKKTIIVILKYFYNKLQKW